MKIIGDLKKGYHIIFESGLILALLLVLSAFKFPAEKQEPLTLPKEDFDVVKTVDIPITNPEKTPPFPSTPIVINKKPNHEIIEESIDELDIDQEESKNLVMPEESATEEYDEQIFEKVEQQAKIKGGIQSLYDDITYPEKAKLANIEGTVKIQFVVNTDGTVKNAKVIRGIGGGCDKEALRAVRNLAFEPGRQRGQAVQVRMKLPVVFRLR